MQLAAHVPDYPFQVKEFLTHRVKKSTSVYEHHFGLHIIHTNHLKSPELPKFLSSFKITVIWKEVILSHFNPYPTAFPYGKGMVLHFYQQQESSTTKTVHKVINKGLNTYV